MRYEYKSVVVIALLCGLVVPSKAFADDYNTSGVTVTRSEVVTTGWESGLIQRDPSLAHWHWNAMSSITSQRLPRKVPATAPGSSHAPAQAQTTTSHYQKPTHVPLPVVIRPCAAKPVVVDHTVTAEAKTSIRYSTKHPAAQAATYRQGYYDSAGTNPRAVAYSSQANVHGKIIARHM